MAVLEIESTLTERYQTTVSTGRPPDDWDPLMAECVSASSRLAETMDKVESL